MNPGSKLEPQPYPCSPGSTRTNDPLINREKFYKLNIDRRRQRLLIAGQRVPDGATIELLSRNGVFPVQVYFFDDSPTAFFAIDADFTIKFRLYHGMLCRIPAASESVGGGQQ